MNPVNKVLSATVDYLVINAAVSLGMGVSLPDILWYSLCVALGFLLRIGVLIKEGKYSHQNLFTHMLFTICWCFLMILFWRTWLSTTWINRGGNSFEIYLFLNSLFSVYMVGQFEVFFKFGIKEGFTMLAGKILAKDIKEDKS